MSEGCRNLWLSMGLLLVLLSTPFTFAQSSMGDAGQPGDAGDTRTGATPIPNGHYSATIDETGDPADWFKFTIGSVTGAAGRPVVDVLLRSNAPAGKRVDLYGPDDADAAPGTQADDPHATARGPGGALSLRASADTDGVWALRITGGKGGYEFELRVGPEDDAGQDRDAPDSDDAPNPIVLTGDFRKSVVLQGALTVRDAADVYEFDVPTGSPRVLAVLRFPTGSELGLELLAPSAAPFGTETRRFGPGIAVDYRDDAPGGRWAVSVTSPDDEQETSYTLAVSINAAFDANAGPDASATLSNGPSLDNGLFTGTITDGGDRVDSYRLVGVTAGERFTLGAASHVSDLLAAPFQVVVTLINPAEQEVHQLTACDQAASITWTATSGGTWFLQAQSALRADVPCEGLQSSSSGEYSFLVSRSKQNEAGTGDAPALPSGTAPLITEGAMRRGGLDRIDTADAYRLGSMARGDVVRLAFATEDTGLDATVSFIDDFGQVISEATTVEGVARVYASAARAGTHHVLIEQHVPEDEEVQEGAYRFFAATVGNEPPIASSLSVPPNGVGRNTIQLRWTQNADSDFVRYEVHQSTSATFTPSSTTKIATYNLRNQTSHTATGLQAGGTYTFLLRTFDETSLKSDSNRVTRTTSSEGGLFSDNEDPSLSDGKVTPAEGGTGTLFRFEVSYEDGNNDPPTKKRVVISGSPRDMVTQDTTYTDGSLFTHETTLPPGEHSFVFQFSDGTTEVSSSHDGPVVSEEGNRPPKVNGTATPSEGDAPLPVEFNVNASDPDGDSLSYSWDFDVNDGVQNDSAAKRVNHTYEEPGQYTAVVTVRDSNGATSSDSLQVTVRESQNTPPIVDPRANPGSGFAPLDVRFTANAQDPDGNITSYAWDFDNANGIQRDSTQANPSHRYATAGSYTATITVTDDGNRTATGSVNVVVRSTGNRPPSVTIIASPPSGPAPLSVNLTANGFDADGDPIEYTWDFDTSDGVGVDASGPIVNHTFANPGRFTIMVVARDDEGAPATASMDIEVESGSAGFGELFIEATPREGRAPLTVAFQADTSRMRSPPESYAWDFGDGSSVETNASAEHTYQSQGIWTVTLTVRDANGTLHQSTIDVTVTGPPRGEGTPSLGVVPFLGLLVVAAVMSRAGRRR